MLSPFREYKLRRLFHMYDMNKNGVLSVDDFVRLAEINAKAMGISPDSPYYEDFAGSLTAWENLKRNCDLNNDGQVTPDEFVRGYANWMERPEFDSVVQGNISNVMSALDLNQDGKISREEFVERFYLGTDEIFDQLDLNGNGYITRDEFYHHTLTYYRSEDPSEVGNRMFGPLDWS